MVHGGGDEVEENAGLGHSSRQKSYRVLQGYCAEFFCACEGRKTEIEDIMDETRNKSHRKGRLQRVLVMFDFGALSISSLGFEHHQEPILLHFIGWVTGT